MSRLDIGHHHSPTKMLRGSRKACSRQARQWQRAERCPAGVRHRDSDCGALVAGHLLARCHWRACRLEKFFFCLTGPYLTRRATIGRLACSEPPLGRGRFVCNLPTCHPHKYNGLYGPGYINVMTPGDPLPPPSRHIEPPFSVGEDREVVEKPSTPGRIIFQFVSRPAPGWGGVAP